MTLQSKIRHERLVRIIGLCGALSCCVMCWLMQSLVGFLLSIPFAATALWAGLQLARPDGWYQARIERDEAFIKSHPHSIKIVIAIVVLLAAAHFIFKW